MQTTERLTISTFTYLENTKEIRKFRQSFDKKKHAQSQSHTYRQYMTSLSVISVTSQIIIPNSYHIKMLHNIGLSQYLYCPWPITVKVKPFDLRPPVSKKILTTSCPTIWFYKSLWIIERKNSRWLSLTYYEGQTIIWPPPSSIQKKYLSFLPPMACPAMGK